MSFSLEDLDEDQLNYLSEEAPPEYLCPIMMVLMKNPVVMPDGQTYEYEAIKAALRINPTSPITRQPMSMNQAIKNYAIKSLIEKYVKDKMSQNKESSKNIAKETKNNNNQVRHKNNHYFNNNQVRRNNNHYVNNNDFNSNQVRRNNKHCINNNQVRYHKNHYIHNNVRHNNNNYINDDNNYINDDNNSNFNNINVNRNSNLNNNIGHNNFISDDDFSDYDENEVINYKKYRQVKHAKSRINMHSIGFSILYLLEFLVVVLICCLVIYDVYKIQIVISSIIISFRNTFISIKQAILSFLINSWNWIVNLFKVDYNIDETSSLFSKAKYYIVMYIKFIIEVNVSFFTNLFSTIFKRWPHILNHIYLSFQKILEIIKIIVINIHRFKKMVFTSIYHFVTEIIPIFFSNGKNILDSIINYFEKFTNVIANIYSLLLRHIMFVYGNLYNIFNFVISFIQNLIKRIT